MKKYLEQDGYGRYGALDIEDGKLVCHECGKTYQQLATHAFGAHGISADQYREKHGLGRTTRLVAPSFRQKMSNAWESNRDLHLESLERRDIAKARKSSPAGHKGKRISHRPEVRAMYQQMMARKRGRALTEAEIESLGDGLDLQAWSNVASRLLQDPTVSSRSIAEACGIAAPTVLQRIRRYPPQA